MSNINKITLYSAEWCGHCKRFKPVWDELKIKIKKYNNQNNSKIKCEYVDSSDKRSIQEGIQGFPTIQFATNENKKIFYDGDRTIDDIFLKISEINRSKKLEGGGKRENYEKLYYKYKKKYLKKIGKEPNIRDAGKGMSSNNSPLYYEMKYNKYKSKYLKECERE